MFVRTGHQLLYLCGPVNSSAGLSDAQQQPRKAAHVQLLQWCVAVPAEGDRGVLDAGP